MTIRIEGVLVRDARFGLWGTDQAVITLRIEAGDKFCLPFEAHVPCGQGPDAQIRARAEAAALRRGQAAMVEAMRVELTAAHGEARLSLRGCTEVLVAGRRLV